MDQDDDPSVLDLEEGHLARSQEIDDERRIGRVGQRLRCLVGAASIRATAISAKFCVSASS